MASLTNFWSVIGAKFGAKSLLNRHPAESATTERRRGAQGLPRDVPLRPVGPGLRRRVDARRGGGGLPPAGVQPRRQEDHAGTAIHSAS